MQGFSFCPAAIQPNTSVYSAFCAVNAVIPPAQRWSVSQRRNASSAYQNHRHARTLYSSAQTPYYNKVYKGAAVRTYCCRSMQARRDLEYLPRPAACNLAPGQRSTRAGRHHGTFHPAGQSSDRGAAGGAEPLAATAASLSGFRPIANRGQQ